MTKEELKAVLIRVVTEKQGLKATELCNDFLDALTDEQRREVMRTDDHQLPDIIDELVKEGSLVEVEYVLPTMNYRAKSFLLPKATKVELLGGIGK